MADRKWVLTVKAGLMGRRRVAALPTCFPSAPKKPRLAWQVPSHTEVQFPSCDRIWASTPAMPSSTATISPMSIRLKAVESASASAACPATTVMLAWRRGVAPLRGSMMWLNRPCASKRKPNGLYVATARSSTSSTLRMRAVSRGSETPTRHGLSSHAGPIARLSPISTMECAMPPAFNRSTTLSVT